MVMQSLREGASKGITKYVLFGVLIMAVGGLVMMDVGGFFRGGGSKTEVGRVGSEKIQVSTFDRTVRRTLNRLGMAPEEAFRLGYINELLSSEIRNALVYQSATKIGINVGRDRIAREVNKLIEPFIEEGRSKQDVLNQVLLSQGMSEREFVNSIGREVASNLLTAAVQGGFSTVSENMAEDIYLFQNEQRDVAYITFPDSDLKDIKPPSDERIMLLYSALKESYAKPETRILSLVKIKEDSLKSTIDIADEDIQAAYDDSIDVYTSPEKRTLEQAILKSEENAQAIFKLANEGSDLRAAVVKVTESEASYIAPQDFEEAGLLPEIKDAVFKAQKGEAAGPVKTALGWHVLVVKDIKMPNTKSFASVRADVEDELKQIVLADQLYALANSVDDMLAGGAALEDVAQEIDLDITTLPAVNGYGQGADGKDALGKYEDKRSVITETGFELLEGETSAVMEMADGSFVAIYVKAVTPKSYTPLEEVRGEIEKRIIKDQRSAENRMRVVAALSEIEATGRSLKDAAREKGKALQSFKSLKRNETELPKPLTQRGLNAIFAAPVGGYTVITTKDGSALVHITSSSFPAKKKEAVATLRESIMEVTKNEVMLVYLESKRQAYGAKVNQDLLNRLYGPGRESF